MNFNKVLKPLCLLAFDLMILFSTVDIQICSINYLCLTLLFTMYFYYLALKLNFKGAANVHWSERHGSGKNRRTRHYRASETYFNVTVSLIGAGTKFIYIFVLMLLILLSFLSQIFLK